MLRVKGIFVLLFLLGMMRFQVQGQESFGLSLNNYSGVWGSQANPAWVMTNKTYLDINLFGGAAHFSNNFAYIPAEDYSLFDLVSADSLVSKYGSYSYNGFYTYYGNDDLKWTVLNTRLNGPSAMFHYNNNVFSVATSFRSVASGVNVPWELMVFLYEGLGYPPLQGIRFDDKHFGLTQLTWEEISFSYAREIFNKFGHSISVGITGKLLFGLEGGYSAFWKADYMALNSDSVYFYEFDADVAFSMPETSLNTAIKHPFNAPGFGVGADIGIVYTKKKNRYGQRHTKRACEAPYEDYIYKIGLSVLDIGGITFNRWTELHTFHIKDVTVNTSDLDTIKGMSADVGMRYLSEVLTGDPNASLSGNRIHIGLPTALSLQFDWHAYDAYYLSLIWVHPLHFRLEDAKRAPQLAVVPRYETRMFGVSLPISSLQYQTPRVGLALRLYSLTVGTECLGTLLNFKDLDSVDFYFSLKFSLDKGRCNSFKRGACDTRGDW